MMTARELAVNLLYKIEVGEAYSNTTLDKELNKCELSREDKALASQIVYGVLTWKLTIDEIIKRYSSIRIKKNIIMDFEYIKNCHISNSLA